MILLERPLDQSVVASWQEQLRQFGVEIEKLGAEIASANIELQILEEQYLRCFLRLGALDAEKNMGHLVEDSEYEKLNKQVELIKQRQQDFCDRRKTMTTEIRALTNGREKVAAVLNKLQAEASRIEFANKWAREQHATS